MPDIERPEVTASRLAVGLTKFNSEFVDHGDGTAKTRSPAPTFRACDRSAWAPRRSDSFPMRPMR